MTESGPLAAETAAADDDPTERIDQALALIDQGLGGLSERQLVSASEITDLLLDVRSLIAEPV